MKSVLQKLATAGVYVKLITLLCVVGGFLSACAPSRPVVVDSPGNLQARAKIHTQLGAGYYQQNQIAVALEEFQEAVQLDPNYALAYNGLGLVYSALGEFAKADANFKTALKLDPKSSESNNNYGSFLCAQGHVDESIVYFLEATKNPLYTTPAVAYTNAGLCYAKKGDTKNAELFYRKALQSDPLMNLAAYHLANLYFHDKKYTLARDALQNAVVNQPSPEVLWLGIQIAESLDDRDAVASYRLELKRTYPDSEQAKSLKQE